jgi:hypothetical protein
VVNTIIRYEETGDIKEILKKSPCRPRLTSKRDDQKLLRLVKEDPFTSFRKLAQEWTVNGVAIGMFKYLEHFFIRFFDKTLKILIKKNIRNQV